jgi:Membrane dipeptidase (Peptidase family M19)
VDELVAKHGLRRALSAADLEAAHREGQPAIVGDVEGLNVLVMKLERLEEAHQRRVRHVQLVHYTPNDVGDFQTGMVTHQGLTSFGAEVIRACHRLGFVCDVAHVTEETIKQAVQVATKPLLLSHTALSGSPAMGPTPPAGPRAVGAAHRGGAARLRARGCRKDRRRQLPADLSRCGRLRSTQRAAASATRSHSQAGSHQVHRPRRSAGGRASARLGALAIGRKRPYPGPAAVRPPSTRISVAVI